MEEDLQAEVDLVEDLLEEALVDVIVEVGEVVAVEEEDLKKDHRLKFVVRSVVYSFAALSFLQYRGWIFYA